MQSRVISIARGFRLSALHSSINILTAQSAADGMS